MKNFLYILICLVCFSCGQRQTRNTQMTTDTGTAPLVVNTPVPKRDPASVEEIKQLYAILHVKLHGGELDSVSLKYDCSGERSGTVTYFSEGGKLKVIKHAYNEYSHFSAMDIYFVQENKLFFAHLRDLIWSFETGKAETGATRDRITEKRIYVSGRKLLLCLEKTFTKRSESPTNPRSENVPNKHVDCGPSVRVLSDFNTLLAFRNSSEQECL